MALMQDRINGEVPAAGRKLLGKMLERVYTSLSTGPAINCRPHASRQRVDLRALARLDGGDARGLLAKLLGESAQLKLIARAPRSAAKAEGDLTEAERAANKLWDEEQALLRKVRVIADDGRNFENDTGVHALYVGFPLLQLPPGKGGPGRFAGTRRILAPIAFVPVELTVKTGQVQSVELSCAATGAERVVPNQALLAWVEQQTGDKLDELFADGQGTQPWVEVNGIVAAVCKAIGIDAPAELAATSELLPVPRSDDEAGQSARVLPAAVLGLFPLSNQSILRDLEAMAAGESLAGPVESFVRVDVSLAQAQAVRPVSGQRSFADERLVSHADPCQVRAVRLARTSRGLVIHGPPGTGKSQTIANVIGDHLGRGERVLFVCDKRTALDVVQHRLNHLGLDGLCAIVHDAQRDQRDLYLGIREQLDGLAESKTNPAAVAELEAVDRELGQIHDELASYESALSARPDGGRSPSFHELVGRWLEIDVTRDAPGTSIRQLDEPRLADLGPAQKEVREVLERAPKSSFPSNPWRGVLGVELSDFLARPTDEWRRTVASVTAAARATDSTIVDGMPVFSLGDAIAEGDARTALAEKVGQLLAGVDAAALSRWAAADHAAITAAQQALEAQRPRRAQLDEAVDEELAIVLRSSNTQIGELVLWLGWVTAYLQIARRWYRWFCFGRKRAALAVLQRFGFALGAEPAARVARFLEGRRARTLLSELHAQTLAPGTAGELPDSVLRKALADHAAIFEALLALDAAGLADCRRLIADPSRLVALRGSAARGRAMARLAESLSSAGLFSAAFQRRISDDLRNGGKVGLYFEGLESRFDTVEGILRIEQILASLPPPLAGALMHLAERSTAADDGWRAIEKAVLAGEIGRRLRDQPRLQAVDGDRLRAYHDRYRALEARKRELSRDAILHLWTDRQRRRLLASTGTRLNSAGTELRRRLMLRGERAMRVRQVIAAGASIEGGDPLFDVRPVWMASPGTVAQIFARQPIFDVVIFDEASQCRLEEALPVMTRARRVVIAGDPKQLPPTRFFESTVVGSTDNEAETEQELFEEQQAEVEDLLGASLNLEIEQCYLDVHYRSRNADLIEFSNRSFYDARLQAIPGHPRNRAVAAPVRLQQVGGVYDKRANPIEAQAVVRIVRELLGRPQPPSLGIACFNLAQREAILDALDEAAAADGEFAGRLAAARTRRGAASFEGLFVKNLENVQGDERDHIIISTTYGPDPKGRFYRRFGPLALAGGGRRLNVLVTRARDEVHIVTSIPPEVYRSLPPVEAGRVPNGAWLLFSYLNYAEHLAQLYTDEAARLAAAEVAKQTTVHVHPSETGSRFATALARQLAERGHSSDVHWGNDGFQVDVALHHPRRAEDVTVGILCDGTRFDKAADKVEWDLFRVQVLESQGWQLLRLWTPHVFRDPAGAQRTIETHVAEFLAQEAPPPRSLELPPRAPAGLPN